jgi:hypothetical protein
LTQTGIENFDKSLPIISLKSLKTVEALILKLLMLGNYNLISGLSTNLPRLEIVIGSSKLTSS